MASSFGWGGVGTSVENVAPSPVTSTPSTAAAQGTTPQPSSASSKQSASQSSSKKNKGKGNGEAAIAEVTPETQSSDQNAVIQIRMDDLSRREEAVAQREAHMRELEGKLKNGGIEVKQKNWPRKCLCIKPFLYHDISTEVPTPNQPVCKAGYYCWMLSVASYLFNFIAVSLMFFMGTANIACWFFAALATVIGVFCSWWTVYSSLYKAVQTRGHTLAYGKYFIHKSIFIAWAIWVIISPPIGTSSCFVTGFFVMIDQFGLGGSKGTTGGVLGIINIVLWGLTLFLAIYTIIWAFTIWKKGGGLEELHQHQQSVSTAAMVFQNDTVNSTAKKLFGGAPP